MIYSEYYEMFLNKTQAHDLYRNLNFSDTFSLSTGVNPFNEPNNIMQFIATLVQTKCIFRWSNCGRMGQSTF